MTKVYIVTEEPYHDNGTIQGVYDSVDKAKASMPEVDSWEPGSVFHSPSWPEHLFTGKANGRDYMIQEQVVQ